MKILHWNILADGLAFDTFANVENKDLVWEKRLPMIVKIIQEYDPDIFDLVEVDHFEDLQNAFPTHYGFFRSKNISNTNVKSGFSDGSNLAQIPALGFGDGSALFVRKNKYEVQSIQTYQLAPNSSQIFVLAKIVGLHEVHDYVQKVPFYYGVCHLKAKSEFSDTRGEQVKAILGLNTLNLPYIIGGDFNDEPNSPCMNLMKEHFSVSHPPDFTTWKSRNDNVVKRVIDYYCFKNFDTKNIFTTIPKNICIDKIVPNCNFPSDHFPICAEIL